MSGSPLADRWMRLPKAPIEIDRVNHVLVWTGNEVIVWGGATNSSDGVSNLATVPLADGALWTYDTP